MKNVIVLQNLTKVYKLYKNPKDRLKEALSLRKRKYHIDFLANDNISFNILKGEVVGIIGRNGSGKSTLLKMITGVLTPTKGNLKINGKITALLELGAGFNPELTGLENLYFSGSINGLNKEEMDKQLQQIISFADIGQFLYQPLKMYSSGMKARLGFAFAIHTQPEILIVDEALSVGDAAFQRKCFAKIEDMCKDEKVTVLFVSHSESVIKQLCTRAIILHEGKLVIDGKSKDVVNIYGKLISDNSVDIEKYRQEFKNIVNKDSNSKKNIKIEDNIKYYDINLKSKSIVRLKENGAKITNVELLDEKAMHKVNILQKDTCYRYRFNVRFFNDYKSVNIAMRIKDIKGTIITGEAQTFFNVKKDKEYLFEFKFKNILNNGYYFFNTGVNTTLYGEFIMLHRIIDVYMIYVNSDKRLNTSRGMVDFNMDFKGTEI